MLSKETKEWVSTRAYISKVTRISDQKHKGWTEKFTLSQRFCDITGYVPSLADGESGLGAYQHFVSNNVMDVWSL